MSSLPSSTYDLNTTTSKSQDSTQQNQRLRQRYSSQVKTKASSPISTRNSQESSPNSKDNDPATKALLLWNELPHWRRDNAFILGGYRGNSNSYLLSFGSIFSLHNESVNIWTHVLGAVISSTLCLLLLLPGYSPLDFSIPDLIHELGARYAIAGPDDILVFGCFFAGATACLGMSATYHTLCNHSETVARVGNKLDYTGIVALIVGSYVPGLWYGLFCEPMRKAVYLTGIFVLGLACGVVSWVEKFRTPRWRPYRALVFVALGASGVLPVCHSLLEHGYDELNRRIGLGWVLLEGFLYIFGAFLYAVRWPERGSPGRFDIWGSSHQLFHILILLAAAAHLRGMVEAFDYHHEVLKEQCSI